MKGALHPSCHVFAGNAYSNRRDNSSFVLSIHPFQQTSPDQGFILHPRRSRSQEMATLIIHKEDARLSVKREEQDRIRRCLDQDLEIAQRLHLVPEILLSDHLPLPGRGTVLPGLGLFSIFPVPQPSAWRGPCGKYASCLVRRWPDDRRIRM